MVLDKPDSSLVVRDLSNATVVMATPDRYSALLAMGVQRAARLCRKREWRPAAVYRRYLTVA